MNRDGNGEPVVMTGLHEDMIRLLLFSVANLVTLLMHLASIHSPVDFFLFLYKYIYKISDSQTLPAAFRSGDVHRATKPFLVDPTLVYSQS